MYKSEKQIVKILAFIFIFSNGMYAQTLFPLKPQSYCQYTNKALPVDFYQLKPDSTADLCSLIIKNTGILKNFELIASNVASAVAIIDSTSQRWVLYSRRHFMENTAPAYRILALAHEIGHHANQHTLQVESKEADEIEANEFSGFAAYRMGISRRQLTETLDKSVLNASLELIEQKAAILRGFDRGEASILIAPHAAFNDNGSGNAIPGIPEFPFPPPQASATYILDEDFKDCKSFSDVEKRLNNALKYNGYHERRYFYTKGGFAIVTRIEQINPDGYSLHANRWNPKPVREEAFSCLSYLKSLINSQPGYFRIFAFIVTNEPLTSNQNHTITRRQAEEWLGQGCFKLPSTLGQAKCNENTTIAAMIYEFKVPESTQKPILSEPSALSGEIHMERSKIKKNLK